MAERPSFEIPTELRTLAERSVEQARQALDGLIGAAHKALDEAEHRADAVQGNARDAGRRVLGFAEENVAAGFDFAARLARARTLDEWIRLHTEFAAEQARRLAGQARAIGGEVAAAAGSATVRSPAADKPEDRKSA